MNFFILILSYSCFGVLSFDPFQTTVDYQRQTSWEYNLDSKENENKNEHRSPVSVANTFIPFESVKEENVMAKNVFNQKASLTSSIPQSTPNIETPQISIIVPAYKENENIAPLTERIFASTRSSNIDAELIIVDDNSNDGSVETVETLQKKGYNVRIHVRKEEKGLSTAVLKGFSLATKDVFVVMDADMQHPPESLPNLVSPLFSNKNNIPKKYLTNPNFVLGSRHVQGGGVDKNWSIVRRLISHGATLLARPLVEATDPMSGFFAIRRSVFESGIKNLNPLGFKIALELLVKCPNVRFMEVGYTFAARELGQSKLKLKTQLQYLQHLLSLYFFKFHHEFYTFGVIFCIALASVHKTLFSFILKQSKTEHGSSAIQEKTISIF